MTALNERAIHAVAAVLMGHVNAPEQAIYKAARACIEAYHASEPDAVAVEREACAKLAEPTNPRPCDCEPYRCYCQNYDDAQHIAAWDEAASLAAAIRARSQP